MTKKQLTITDLYDTKVQMGSLDLFTPNEWNVNEMDEETFNGLKESIETTNGKYLRENPIKVRKDNGVLQIIDGEHRWRICKELGIEKIPFEIIDIDLDKAKKLNVIYTRHRGDENYFKLSKLLNEYYEEKDITQGELAKEFGLGNKSRVNNILKIFPNLKDHEEKVSDSKLSNASLEELASCRSDLLREKLIDKTIENKWASKTIRTNASKFNQITDYLEDILESEDDRQNVLESLTDEVLFEFGFDAIKNRIDDLTEEILKKKIIQGDAFEEITKLEEVDHIITDPPYNLTKKGMDIVFENRKDISTKFGDWDIYEDHEFLKFLRILIEEGTNKLAKGGSFLIFTSDHYISYIIDIMKDCGLTYRSTLYWHKTNPTNSVGKNSDVSSVEVIAYATKEGKRTFNWLGQNKMHNHIETSICMGNERTTHPTQKPLEVIKWLLEKYTNSGDLILDPFAGSGTTGIACKEMKRNFILIEKEEKYIDLIDMRFKSLEVLSDEK